MKVLNLNYCNMFKFIYVFVLVKEIDLYFKHVSGIEQHLFELQH